MLARFDGQLSGTVSHVVNLHASADSEYHTKDVSFKTTMFESKGHVPWFNIKLSRKTFEHLKKSTTF